MPKINELWSEVEKSLREGTDSGYKTAILEAHKVLSAVLDSKGIPGNTIEKQLYWAGYSLKDKEGIREALDKHDEILERFDYQLSDLEAEEIVRKYKHVIDEISAKPKFSFKDKVLTFTETQLHPKSLAFWRNLTIFIGFFVLVKFLSKTTLGLSIINFIIELADLIISWQFLLLILVIVIFFYALNIYFANKTKVKIKEEEQR